MSTRDDPYRPPEHAEGVAGSSEYPAPPPPARGQGQPDPTYADPAPGWQGQPQQQERNGLGLAALIVGLIGLVLSVLFFPVGFVLDLVAIGLAIPAMKRARRGEATNFPMPLIGLIAALLGLLVAIAFALFVGSIWSQTKECNDPGLSQIEREQCIRDELNN